MKLGQFIKEKNLSKNSTKTENWKVVPGPFEFAKNEGQPLLKMKFLEQATYITYVTAKLLKFVQISTQTSSDSFLQTIIWKLKRAWN